MKTILAAFTILAFLITGVFLWRTAHTRSVDVSFSQIYIHGTPVCVVRQDGEIVASIGMCDADAGRSRERDYGTGRGSLGESPYEHGAPTGLPPGHPPVDSIPSYDESRKIPI